MIYDNSKPILNKKSFDVAKDSIDHLYLLNEKIQEVHFTNQYVLKDQYNSLFYNVFEANLCEESNIVKLDLIPYDCSTFLATSVTHVRVFAINFNIGSSNCACQVF